MHLLFIGITCLWSVYQISCLFVWLFGWLVRFCFVLSSILHLEWFKLRKAPPQAQVFECLLPCQWLSLGRGCGRCSFAGRSMSLGVGFESSLLHSNSSLLSLLHVWSGRHGRSASSSMPATCCNGFLAWWTCSLLEVTGSQVKCFHHHSNRKVTNTVEKVTNTAGTPLILSSGNCTPKGHRSSAVLGSFL